MKIIIEYGRIEYKRKKKGFTQEDIAKMLKIDRTTYIRKIMGRQIITAEELILISRKLDMSIEECYSVEVEKDEPKF